VTFALRGKAAGGAREVARAGEFNESDTGRTALKEHKDGSFGVTLDLGCNREYRYRSMAGAGKTTVRRTGTSRHPQAMMNTPSWCCR